MNNMSKEYIDRDEILPAIEAYIELPTAYENIEREIRNIPPAADVSPVVHGEWVYKTDEDAIWRTKAICSACKYVVANNTHLTHEYGVENFEKLHKFCPNCGAKMDGGEK